MVCSFSNLFHIVSIRRIPSQYTVSVEYSCALVYRIERQLGCNSIVYNKTKRVKFLVNSMRPTTIQYFIDEYAAIKSHLYKSHIPYKYYCILIYFWVVMLSQSDRPFIFRHTDINILNNSLHKDSACSMVPPCDVWWAVWCAHGLFFKYCVCHICWNSTSSYNKAWSPPQKIKKKNQKNYKYKPYHIFLM